MNILFLMLAFPDLEKTSSLYTDLVEEFAQQGHNVFPVAPCQDDKKTGLYSEKEIEVLRVKTLPLFTNNKIVKGIANVMLPFQYKRAINKFYKGIKFDLVVMPTPPITLLSVAKYIKERDQAQFYLILRDIFPQNAVDLGMMRKDSMIYNKFRKTEEELYQCADKIGCMSQGNIDYVIQHNPTMDHSKLHILMNFQKPEELERTNEDLKAKYGLKDKFVLLFGGNMGVPQKMENVIAFAKACEKYEDVRFLILGKGTQRDRIEALVKDSDVHNVVFQSFIPRAEYQQLVAQCDVGLISLNEKFSIPNIPSKALSYFSVGLPVLASVDEATDFDSQLIENGAGFAAHAGRTDDLLHEFEKLYHDRQLCKAIGANGKHYFDTCMTTEVAYKTIMSELN